MEKSSLYLAHLLSQHRVGSISARRIIEETPQAIIDKFELPSRLLHDLERWEVQLVPYWDEAYPQQLLRLDDFPAMLFVRGRAAMLSRESIAAVGTRTMSAYGKSVIGELVRILAGESRLSEVNIISGLAFGVDAEVHRCSLEYGLGSGAVVAAGIDNGFPTRNSSLHRELSEFGFVISEFPPGKPIVKGMFPMRNRLIAALSSAVIVVEAKEVSGALITARLAAELGIAVGAFPGCIDMPNSCGCNRLIGEGANMLISLDAARDFINESLGVGSDLLAMYTIDSHNVYEEINNLERRQGYVSTSELAKVSSIDILEASTHLTKLQHAGILVHIEVGMYKLKR